MTYRDNFEKWLNDEFFDEETREELSNLTDEKEIEDRCISRCKKIRYVFIKKTSNIIYE